MDIQLTHLRRYAIARTLFKPTTLGRALEKLGFVQADPIRAPARAQDLILRHRVKQYQAGELEKRYAKLGIEEDFFVNYGFLKPEYYQLMHPREPRRAWSALQTRQAADLLRFIEAHGPTHPRVVDAHFAHGRVKNWFGGTSNASTQLLDGMHYRGMLRVAYRESGTRVYALAGARDPQVAQMHPNAKMDALIDVVVRKYAPLSATSLGQLVRYLLGGVPQWSADKVAALQRAKARLAGTKIESVHWYWPTTEKPASSKWGVDDKLRFLAPFDPIVWDRARFEVFWGWRYRFEAYTPAAKRQLGYYALPLLWREKIIGWANLTMSPRGLQTQFGYVSGSAPRERAYRLALDEELNAMQRFLGLEA